MRSLILLTQNQYSVVSHFFSGIKLALENMGYAVDILYCDNPDTIAKGFVKLAPIEAYDHIFSFNGNGLGKITDSFNTLAFAKLKPVYVYCVDNPIHVIPRFYGHPVTVLCVAEEHVALMRQFGHKASYFPHAVMDSKKCYPAPEIDNKNENILFPISFMSSESAKSALTPVWEQLGEGIDASNSVTDFLRVIGVVPTETSPARTKFDENIRRITVLVDRFLRARERERCLLYCASRKIKLNVVGRDSLKFRALTDYHDYNEAINFSDLLKEMSLSRWVLHQSPGFEEGLHERIVYPLVCGTPVIVWKYPHVLSAMRNKGVIDFADYDALNKEDSYIQLLTKGKQEVLDHHTWSQRLSALLTDTK